MADYYFDVWKDDFGNLNLKIPPKLQGQCQEEFRSCGQRGLLVYYAVFALQSRLDQLEKRLISVESIPRVTEIASATDTVNGVQPPLSPLKRMGRADLCRFGYRPDPRNNAKLLPDKEEQATIRRAQHFRKVWAESQGSLPNVGPGGPRAARQEMGREPVGPARDFAPRGFLASVMTLASEPVATSI